MDGRGRSDDGPDVGKREYLQVGGPKRKTMDRDGADLFDCGMQCGASVRERRKTLNSRAPRSSREFDMVPRGEYAAITFCWGFHVDL